MFDLGVCNLFLFRLILCVSILSVNASVFGKENSTGSLKDPTQPIGYSASAKRKPSLKLQAIFWGANRKEAIVNGQSVKEGDTVLGKRIVKIKQKEIVVENSSGRFTLVLRPSIFK